MEFTEAMRDRQARGKNAYREESDEEKRTVQLGQGFPTESFFDREKRAFAMAVLDSRELLTMYALSRNDSIPGTRQYFTAMLLGYDDKKEQR